MAFFEWDSSMETGITVVDEQHRKLVGFVNDLHEAMRTKKTKEVLGGLLKGLADYCGYHFATEEKAFARHGYSRREEHTRKHQDLVAQVSKLIERYEQQDFALTVEVLHFLIDWVKTHIMQDDMLYVPELGGKEIKA